MTSPVTNFVMGQSPDPLSEWLTLTQAADRLQICTATLREWRENKKVKCFKYGRIIRVSASEVERLLKENEA